MVVLPCCVLWSALLAADAAAPRYRLAAARLEPRIGGEAPQRYTLKFALEPAPPRTRLEKAGAPVCPLPGSIFSDGYESP